MNINETLQGAIIAYNRDKQDTAKRDALLAACDNKPCFFSKDGDIDVEASLRAYRVMVDTGLKHYRGARSLEEIAAEVAPEYQADPISRELLVEGVTAETEPPVDWGPVSVSRRLVAAYATTTNQIPSGMTSETVAQTLAKPTLELPWSRIEAEWRKLEASTKTEDMILALQIKARLRFERRDTPATVVPSRSYSYTSTSNARLTGPECAELRVAMMDAFPRLADWDLMLSTELDTTREYIAFGEDLTDIAFKVINHFNRHNQIPNLLAGARHANPRNKALLAFATKYGER